MISAAEAKAIYDASGAEVDNYLQYQVGPKIKKSAESGKRQLFHIISAEETWKTIVPTPIQMQMVAKLESLGYRAAFGRDGDPYVPRGLADDDGNGPKHTNYGITISW